MASEIFLLELRTSAKIINLLDGGYKVMNGGFQIDTPQIDRQFVEFSSGFYRPSLMKVGMRTGRIVLSITSSSRSGVLQQIHAIESMLQQVARRSLISGGARCELAYQWAGQEYPTVFEVYGGEVNYPEDLFSLERMFVTDRSGSVILHDIEVTLQLSGYGYSASFDIDRSRGPISVPIAPNTSSLPTTDPVTIHQPGYNPYTSATVGAYNFVKIHAGAFSATAPSPVEITLSRPTNDATKYKAIHVGHAPSIHTHTAPTAGLSPENLNGGVAPLSQFLYGDVLANANAFHGYYIENKVLADGPFFEKLISTNNIDRWRLPGMYNVYLHQFIDPSVTAAHTWKYMTSLLRTDTDAPKIRGLPISVSQAYSAMLVGSFSSAMAEDSATLFSDFQAETLAIYMAGNTLGTLNIDYMSVMPITWGFRIYDFPSWTGLPYDWTLVDSAYKKHMSVMVDWSSLPRYYRYNALLNSIKLEPGVDNYLYFTIIEDTSTAVSTDMRNRSLDVQIKVFPAFSSLAY